jgi:transglutaminase-like putative cysteine protease
MLTELPSTPSHELVEIPDGTAGVIATVEKMVDNTRIYKKNFAIRSLAERIASPVTGKNWYGQAEAIQNWVRDNIHYMQDVADVETLKTPLALVLDPFGDCDDMASLAGTLLQAIGHPVRYVAVGTVEPGVFEHVYVETKIGNRWVGMDTTEDVPLGWIPEPQLARLVRNV